ncbi:hypothetical protein B0H13DRAFT_1923970 [Mycena leptocephala]|nr:hypothetical protein B0H13DRAFT_1923970 [Mycena leptocephala]
MTPQRGTRTASPPRAPLLTPRCPCAGRVDFASIAKPTMTQGRRGRRRAHHSSRRSRRLLSASIDDLDDVAEEEHVPSALPLSCRLCFLGDTTGLKRRKASVYPSSPCTSSWHMYTAASCGAASTSTSTSPARCFPPTSATRSNADRCAKDKVTETGDLSRGGGGPDSGPAPGCLGGLLRKTILPWRWPRSPGWGYGGIRGVEPRQCWSEEARTRTRTQIVARRQRETRDMVVLYNAVLRSKGVLGRRRGMRPGGTRTGAAHVRRRCYGVATAGDTQHGQAIEPPATMMGEDRLRIAPMRDPGRKDKIHDELKSTRNRSVCACGLANNARCPMRRAVTVAEEGQAHTPRRARSSLVQEGMPNLHSTPSANKAVLRIIPPRTTPEVRPVFALFTLDLVGDSGSSSSDLGVVV